MIRRVLFVDDEPSIRAIYEMLPPFLGEQYHVTTAANAREALEHVSRETFDVVVSDLVMPEVSGAELLAKVAELSPAAARVVVSGFADEITVAKCLAAAHRYFTKPFDPIALTTAIISLNQAREAVMSGEVRKLVGKLESLPTPSETYLQLMKALNSQDKPLSDIAAIVERDPSLAAKVLQAVNSAMFGAGRRIVCLDEALQVLGLHIVRALVLTIQVFDFYRSPSLKGELQKVWTHSSNVARRTREFCRERRWPPEITDEAFLAALLHDIGRIILAATPEPERLRLFPDYRVVQDEKVSDLELGLAHAIEAEAGGYLLSLWGIPESIIEAVRNYRAGTGVSADTRSPTTALAVAHELELAEGNKPKEAPQEEIKSVLIISADAGLTALLAEQCRQQNRFQMVAPTESEAYQLLHDLQFDLALVDARIFPHAPADIPRRLRQVNGNTRIDMVSPEEAKAKGAEVFNPARA